jgi:hypothetical protein
MDAPHFLHEYLRLPPLAVFSMRSPHKGHAFGSCFMGSGNLSAMAILRQRTSERSESGLEYPEYTCDMRVSLSLLADS